MDARRRVPGARLALVLATLTVAAACAACVPRLLPGPSAPVGSGATVPTAAPAPADVTSDVATDAVSSDSGAPLVTAGIELDPSHASMSRSHRGETIGLAIIASSKTRSGALVTAAAARRALSEFDTYYVVDRSDHFAGLTPGLWVAFEAHTTAAKAREKVVEDAPWLQRAGIKPYAKAGTVLCEDRFVLFEDAVR